MSKCKCKCKCKVNEYIVLQDFWLRDIKLMKGQIITDPVSPRWITLRLIAPYRIAENSVKIAAQKVAEELHKDLETEASSDNEVETSEITVPEKPKSDKSAKKRRGRPRKDTVIVELPEKSEMVLEKMIQAEIDSL